MVLCALHKVSLEHFHSGMQGAGYIWGKIPLEHLPTPATPQRSPIWEMFATTVFKWSG
jgi:hypothetical protein